METYSYENESQNKTKTIIFSVVISSLGVVLMIVAILNILSWDDNKDNSSLSTNYLTYSNYLKIENGMTYDEVVEIFEGHEGVLDTSAGSGDFNLEYYTWKNDRSVKYVTVGFENGYVCAKSQMGLR